MRPIIWLCFLVVGGGLVVGAAGAPPGVPASLGEGTVGFLNFQSLNGCRVDGDCIRVKADCCGCALGGADQAINRKFQSDYNQRLQATCIDAACNGQGQCTALKPRCIEGLCSLAQ